MRIVRWMVLLAAVASLGGLLAACGGDNKGGTQNGAGSATPGEIPATATGGGFNPGTIGFGLDTGPGLDVGIGTTSGLPGCSDPGNSDCPMPVVMELTATAVADGVQIGYPERYFVATTGGGTPPDAPQAALITISPSEKNVYQQKAVFEVYRAESVEAALAGLDNPDSADWSTGTLTGTIAVVKDQTQDPPVNTTIGAFGLADGRAIVLKLTTTGSYGWDLWSRLYEDMLNSLTVSE